MELRDRRKRPPTPQRSIEATSLFKIRGKGGGHGERVSAWRETWGRPSFLTHSRRTDMKDVDRKDGAEGGKMGREGKWERRYYALSATEVGGVTLLASKNTRCAEHDFESIINASKGMNSKSPDSAANCAGK